MCGLMAGSLSLTGCKDDDNQSQSTPDSNRTPMSFTADVEGTRSSIYIEENSEINGVVWMYVWTDSAELFHGYATCTDGNLVLNGECNWPDDIEDTVYVTALYDNYHTIEDSSPFAFSTSFDATEYNFVVPNILPIDMTFYENMSKDVLIAHNKLTRDKSDLGTVPLTFRHITAKVQFNAMGLDDTYYYYIKNIYLYPAQQGVYSTEGIGDTIGSWISYSEYITKLEEVMKDSLGERKYTNWLTEYGSLEDALEYHGQAGTINIFENHEDAIAVSTTMTQLTDTMDNGGILPIQLFTIPGECEIEIEYSIWSKDTTYMDNVMVIIPAEEIETATRTGTINLTGNTVNQVLLYLNAYELYVAGEGNDDLLPE